MNIEHDKVKFISGPVVGILLSGKINNIEKNILLFGDYHYKYDQNECPNPDSIQIKDYLHSLFKNSNEPIDFFLEKMKKVSTNKDYLHSPFYLYQLRDYMNDNSNMFKNVKFHYSDIRNNYIYQVMDNFILNRKTINNILCTRDIYLEEIDDISYKVNFFINTINILINLLKDNKTKLDEILNSSDPDEIDFFKNINKIINKYENKKVQTELRRIIKLSTVGLSEDLTKLNKMLNRISTRIKKKQYYSFYERDKILYKLGTLYYKTTHKSLMFLSLLTDIYTVRRILEKDYIKNVITYTGAAHTTNLTNIFINYFNFKVIGKFENSIKIPIDNLYFQKYYTKYNDDINANAINPIREQCIDISKSIKEINKIYLKSI